MQEDKFSGFLVVYHKGQFWMAKMVVHQKGHFWRVKKVPNIPLELHAIQHGYRTASVCLVNCGEVVMVPINMTYNGL